MIDPHDEAALAERSTGWPDDPAARPRWAAAGPPSGIRAAGLPGKVESAYERAIGAALTGGAR